MNRMKIFCLLAAVVVMAACGKRVTTTDPVSDEERGFLEGDRGVYGMACDGCTDSVFLLLPLDCSDPIAFNVIDATKRNRVFGRARIGDWVVVIPNEADSTIADMVVNLDELKGTWCYTVMPHLRDASLLTPQEIAKRMHDMPDSLKEEYFIPREYGFTLKQQWQAQSVGYMRRSSTIDDDTPVEYPQLAYFSEWHMLNGKLVMTSGEPSINEETQQMELKNERRDTCDILYLRDDSLVLGSDGMTRGYYRRTATGDINKEANAAAEKRQQQALEELKK